MVINYRKLWTALGIACLSPNLAAVSTSSNTSSSSSQMNSTDQNMMASGLIYAGPQLGEDAKGISLGADYILWQVVQEGLEVVHSNYYLVDNAPLSYNPTSPSLGSTGYPKFNFLSGFKVHAGVTLADCEDVDLFLQYIWLQRTTGTKSGTGGATTYPAFNNDTPVNSWSSSFKTSYNVLDLEMGRLASYAKDTISIRNFWGIRGVWNTHNFDDFAVGPFADTVPINVPLDYNSYQNTSGAGVRAGTNIAWQLFANKKYFDSLKIIGMSAISGVYGRTYVDTLVSFAVYGVDYYSICNRTSLNRIIPVVDLSIGLSWNMDFGGEKDNDYNFEIHALWDTQSWIGYGKFNVGLADSQRGASNLTVQGFTIGAQMMF